MEALHCKLQHNFLLAAAPLLALAMVSNVVFRSHKVLKIRNIKPFKLLAIVVFIIALVATEPEAIGFLFCFLYAVSGPFEWIVGWKKPTEDEDIFSVDVAEDQSIEDHNDEQKPANLSHISPRDKKS